MERGAKTTHVLVIRRKGPEKIVGIEVNVASITSGYNVQSDIWLRNYDIVYVPKTRLQSAGEFIAIINDILYPPVDHRGARVADPGHETAARCHSSERTSRPHAGEAPVADRPSGIDMPDSLR